MQAEGSTSPPSRQNDTLSVPCCPGCGRPSRPSPFGTLFDLLYGATLSYAIFEYVQLILKVVFRFNALKHDPWGSLLQRLTGQIALRFYTVSLILLYIITDFGDRKKREPWLPLHRDSHYLTQVLISSLFAASVALAARGHFGVALPFAGAVALGGYSSYLTEWECATPEDRSFFRRESSMQGVGAAIGLIAWTYFTFNRGENDSLTAGYVLFFAIWLLALLMGVQEIPRQEGHRELAERYQVTIGLPNNLFNWLKHPFTAPPQTESSSRSSEGGSGK